MSSHSAVSRAIRVACLALLASSAAIPALLAAAEPIAPTDPLLSRPAIEGLSSEALNRRAAEKAPAPQSEAVPAPLAVPLPTQLRAELGKRLFFDTILSVDRTVSCASCHKPELAFADDRAVSPGVGGKLGSRNTPSVMNSSGRTMFFWDGRAETLEDQALFPIANPVEMALPVEDAIKRLNADPTYSEQFQQAYGGPATPRSLGRALAAFQKTLDTANSPYDRYAHGDDSAVSESARRGRLLFIGRGKCAECHSGEDFTSDRFRNIGLYDGRKHNDRGRGAITTQATDDGHFKVPSLRNVAVTAPYMHDGQFKTLREVIDYYDDPDKVVPGGAKGRDASMSAKLGLTEQEKADLEAFLRALTDDRFTAAAGKS
jgi:cytochrome c peroxidase